MSNITRTSICLAAVLEDLYEWLDGFYGCTVTLTSVGYGTRKKKLCTSSLRRSQEVLEVDGEPPVSQQAPPFPLSIALPRLQQFDIGITISKQEGKSVIGVIFLVGFGVVAIRFIEAIAG
ncbi:unnamed protein product [Prunus armeniaca]|uniref:Uncharacterized protein n=1 Tax=Prunus armeniaca TaxID=36596 RepID=A0A6J5XVN3_PRUAR|nr:unnamed protein product [Prunus armeniaca]